MTRKTSSWLVAISIVLSAISLPLFTPEPASAAGFRSTYGTDFWVTFDLQITNPPTAAKIFVAAVSTASVEITWADSSTASSTVNAGAVLTIDALPKWQPNTSADGVATTGIHLKSDVAVTVYLLNNATATTDAAIAYPTPFLGTRYRVTAAPNELNGIDGTRFSVVATTDSTVITVSPSVNFGSRTGPYQVSLNAGETYTAESTLNIIGTLIESNFPVQVTSTNKCANLGYGACDHLFEFMTPTDTWGKSFVLAGAPNTVSRGDRYVVMSDEANTDVWVNGSLTTLSNGGDYLLFTGNVDDTIGRGEVVTSSKPVLVMQFIDYGSYGSPSQTGDPAMVVVPPVAQFLNDAIFTTPATGFAQNSVTVVAKTAEVGAVTLDGTAISASDFKELTGTQYSIARLFITLGTHRVTSTTGVGVFSYGYNGNDSYAYSAGSGLVNLVTYPGGVEQVGYVAVEQISGNDNQSPVQTQAAEPTIQPTAKPMSIKLFEVSPKFVFYSEPVLFTGKHLDEITSASIDGFGISISSQTENSLYLILPSSLSTGTKTVVFSSTEGTIYFQDAFLLMAREKISFTIRADRDNSRRQSQLEDIAYAVTLLPDWITGIRCTVNGVGEMRAELIEFCSELTKLNTNLARKSLIEKSTVFGENYLRVEAFK